MNCVRRWWIRHAKCKQATQELRRMNLEMSLPTVLACQSDWEKAFRILGYPKPILRPSYDYACITVLEVCVPHWVPTVPIRSRVPLGTHVMWSIGWFRYWRRRLTHWLLQNK